jgi:hypothetical protein
MAKTDIWLRQRAGTEFLMAEGERMTCIHEHLFRVYKKAAVDVSVIWQWIRWITKAATGGEALCNKPWSSDTCTAVTVHNICQTDEFLP